MTPLINQAATTGAILVSAVAYNVAGQPHMVQPEVTVYRLLDINVPEATRPLALTQSGETTRFTDMPGLDTGASLSLGEFIDHYEELPAQGSSLATSREAEPLSLDWEY